MRIHVLGTAAFGGFPAWNDGSAAALRARQGDPDVPPRSSTALAVSADGQRYTLLEAPLHLPATLAKHQRYAPRSGTRDAPIDGVVLTNAAFESSAGALALGASSSIRVLSSVGLRNGLLDSNGSYTSIEPIWSGFAWDRPFPLDRQETLEARFFPLPGPTPIELAKTAPKIGRSQCGVRITDRSTGFRCVWAPRIARLDSGCLAELRNADLRFIDGTYYTREEARTSRPGAADAFAEGHVPIDGEGGSLAWLSGMRGESFYIHLSGTNPACDMKSVESERIREAGVDVAMDGQEFDLGNRADARVAHSTAS